MVAGHVAVGVTADATEGVGVNALHTPRDPLGVVDIEIRVNQQASAATSNTREAQGPECEGRSD